MRGTFFGIGVGPGDPELLTVKAIKAIEQVDVLIAPKTEKKEGSVALEIARPYLKEHIEIVYQVFPMVKDFADSTDAWEANKEEILALLNAGKNVAFLTLGDPMFFSTYIYVFRLLEHEDIDIVTIPGVPAFAAIGSRIRQQDPRQARFGVVVEAGSHRAVIEIGIDGSRPVKEIVRDVQETIIRALAEAGEHDDASETRQDSDSSGVGNRNAPQVTVRVQSLL